MCRQKKAGWMLDSSLTSSTCELWGVEQGSVLLCLYVQSGIVVMVPPSLGSYEEVTFAKS